MALIKCKECDGQVSDKALTCPHCGYPLKKVKQKRNIKKLPNGYGTIKHYNRSLRNPYGAFPPVKDYDNNGNAIRGKAIGYYPTYQDAYNAIIEYNKSPYDTDAKSVTFEEVYNMYYEDKYVKNKKRVYSKSSKELTSASYKHCKPFFTRTFTDIRANELQDFIDGLSLRHASLEGVVSLLKTMWKFAIQYEITEKNVAQYLKINIADDDEKGVPFSERELKILWDNSDDDFVKSILLLIYSGFRVSEFLTAELNEEEMYYVGGVKTRAGKNRIVPVNNMVIPFIECRQKGMIPSAYRTTFDKCLKSLGIATSEKGTKHTPHDCRHTFSWLCDKYKVDDFSKHLLMGHSLGNDVEKSVYGHRTVDELRVEINKITRET